MIHIANIVFLVMLVVVVIIGLSSCQTADPMPKWHGYELRFGDQK